MTPRVARPLLERDARRQLFLAFSGVPVAAAGITALTLVAGPPLAMFLGEVQISTPSGSVDPASPPAVATMLAMVLFGALLAVGVVAADRAVAARLVPPALSRQWPRRILALDAVWRLSAWLALRCGIGFVTAAWGWFALSIVVNLVPASIPLGLASVWRLALAVALLIATLHAARGVGWLLTGLAHDLLGPSPRGIIAELGRRAAALRHRTLVARELHDSVGHRVTVMVVQAAAARSVLDRDPAHVANALAAIEQTGRTAMDDLGRVLDLLHDNEPSMPGLDGLPSLVASSRAAGLPVELSVSGDARAVPSPVGALVFRIVQEGCTNVFRHAGGAPTRITVHIGPTGVRLEMTNEDGQPQAGLAPAGSSSGRGLAGLAERAEAIGGWLRAGPRPEGGFQLTAWLPLESP